MIDNPPVKRDKKFWQSLMKNARHIWERFLKMARFVEKHSSFMQTVILAITLYFAVQIGITQNSINQSSLDLNFEPSLSLSYSKPLYPLDSGLKLTNNGKTNVDYYISYVRYSITPTSTAPTENMTVDNSSQVTIAPGNSVNIPFNFAPQQNDFGLAAVSLMESSANLYVPFDIFVKMADQTKYIFDTEFLVQRSGDNFILSQTNGSYEKYNWKEK